VPGERRKASFPHGLSQAQAALDLARQLHRGQRRRADGAPFIAHPTEVALILHCAGAPEDLIVAGALDDTIEKTPLEASELERRFGAAVARVVIAVSEDKSIMSYPERKAALRARAAEAGEGAVMVLAADMVSKAGELRIHPEVLRRSRPPRLAHYRECLTLLEGRLPGCPLVGELRSELDALRTREAGPQALSA
jgi:hypothetical protein